MASIGARISQRARKILLRSAIGLAIIIALFRNKQTLNIDEINLLKW